MAWGSIVASVIVGVVGVAGCSSADDGGSPGVTPGPTPVGPSSGPDAAAALVITSQPASVSVNAGATATFSVKISGGAASVAYQWKRGGVAVAGATSQSYTTPATVLADSGAVFTVDVISEADALTSAAATLTVIAGKTWGPAVQLSTGDANSQPRDARVAIDGDGNGMAVWREITPGKERNAVWASRQSSGGAWSTAATIDAAVGNSTLPQVAMTPTGTAVALFLQDTLNSGGITHLVTTRFTSAWSTPEVLDAASVVNADVPQVALTPDGAATATFLEPDNMYPRVWATRSTTAGVWDAPAVVDLAGGAAPALTVAANGDTLATWLVSGAGSKTLWASRNVGAGWTAPAKICDDSGVVGQPIKTVADAKGDMLSVWSQYQGSGKVAVRSARMDAATGVWSAPVTLNDGTRNANQEQVAGDANGDAVAIWYDENAGVFASRFTASTTTWSAPLAVSGPTLPVSAVFPQIAIDGGGDATAVWLQGATDANVARLYAAHFAASAGTWSAPLDLMVDANAYAQQTAGEQIPSVSVDASGDAVVVWYQRTDAPVTATIWSRTYR